MTRQPPPQPRSALGRWGRTMARHRWLVLTVWLLLLVTAGALYPVLQSRLGVPDYSVRGSESARAQTLLAQRFPELGDEQDVLVFRSSRYPATSEPFRQFVTTVLDTVRNDSDVTAVVGPYDPAAVGQLSSSGQVALALVGLRGSEAVRATTVQHIQDRVRAQAAGGVVDAYLTGSSPLNNDLAKVELRDQEVAEGIGIPVALVILLLALGGLVAAALPVGLALAGVLTCLGVLAGLTGPLHLDQFVTVITTMIGLGVGIDYALFVVSRFREELAQGRARDGSGRAVVDEAISTALRTSGRTIVVSGLIVIVALGAMAVIDGHIFTEIAVAAGLVVGCCLLAGLTLLPALLAVLGDRVNSLALPRRFRPVVVTKDGRLMSGRWAGWARFALTRPFRLGVPALLVLVLLGLPTTAIRLGFDLGLSSLEKTPSGQGAQIVAAAFHPGVVGPVQLVGCTTRGALSTTDLDAVSRLTASARADPAVAQVASVTDVLDQQLGGHTVTDLRLATANPALAAILARMVDPAGQCVVLTVVPAHAVDSPAASALVTALRQDLVPRALAGAGMDVHVGGLTAAYLDLSAETTDKLPLVIAIVLGLSFCYLVVVFRSLLLPLTAVALNLLVTAAALGLTVFVFQQGHGAGVLGFTSVGSLQAYLPVALFALLFGLSMDYEVFLVRRIQEEWLDSGDNTHAVTTALDRTARQISAGAAIMVAVFGSFLAANVLELKQFGFGLAVAVLLDATVVRMVLVPSLMGLLGRANWWLPDGLVRLLPPARLE
ncbi:MAG TPA: MMPL family transporter [Amycolatopsis sp.]|uniref:MMPL family transporter n=1 Tax=Amycolatopsis sp. TaxID=37632 RepID=UPI002B46F04C|nr:MMPL family transporter [Amycolatopsis sp.]HKS46937.1 MMPL family transporter [Amycolatopsis sp.]